MSASSSLYQGDFIPVSYAIASHPGAAMLTERPISLPESAFPIPVTDQTDRGLWERDCRQTGSRAHAWAVSPAVLWNSANSLFKRRFRCRCRRCCLSSLEGATTTATATKTPLKKRTGAASNFVACVQAPPLFLPLPPVHRLTLSRLIHLVLSRVSFHMSRFLCYAT